MRSKSSFPFLSALLAGLAAGLPAPAATAPAQTIPVPESIVARNVPELPRESTADLFPWPATTCCFSSI